MNPISSLAPSFSVSGRLWWPGPTRSLRTTQVKSRKAKARGGGKAGSRHNPLSGAAADPTQWMPNRAPAQPIPMRGNCK
jgi:hypothetical protein